MKTSSILAVCLLLSLGIALHGAAQKQVVAWSDDYAAAQEMAAKNKKHVLVLVANTTLTRGSRLLCNQVFTNPQLAQWVDQYTVPVLIDFGSLDPNDAWHQEQYHLAMRELAVHEVPTILLMGHRGKEAMRLENFVGTPLALLTQFAQELGQDDVLRTLGPVADRRQENRVSARSLQ